MSQRFVRCPHCRIPHDAAERVCPNTGLSLGTEARAAAREHRKAALRRKMDALALAEPPRELIDGGAPNGGARGAAGRSAAAKGGAPDDRDLIGQTIGGRYRVHGVLGEGGMGTVFDAEHLGLSRPVAIKVLSPSQAQKRVAVKRFQQEARAAGGIGHPNICEVYDLGVLDDGSPYLVMERLIGETLADRVSKERRLPPEDVANIVGHVLSGLIAAHGKGIVHRDIKPENIFLARRVGSAPIVKLLDFGVSKMMLEYQTGDDALDLTRTGMVMGTPYYMSPEQARGERNLDGRVDVYACGVVMYEALAGRRPFVAANYNALLLAIISTTPPPLRELRPTIPPALEAVVQRAMAKDRAKRYPSAVAFLRDLKAALPAGDPRPPPRPPTPEERKRAPVLGGGRARAPRPAEPVARADGPGATLRSRMVGRPRDSSTRIDARKSGAPARGGAREQRAPSALAFDDPTEVFQPRGRLPGHAPPSRLGAEASDEWDVETVIHRPDSARGSVFAKPPARSRAPHPFDGEDTIRRVDPEELERYDSRVPRPRRS